MTVHRSQTLEPSTKSQENNQVREAHTARHAVDISPPGNAPVSAAHGIRPPSNSNHHTAFMQCRTCCNCNSQCSYFGKGNFDAQGNFVGS